MDRVRVVLVDDERIVLKGITALLKRQPDLELAGVSDNGLDGLNLILKERPEIVLTDIRMPGMSGLELIRKAREVLPDTVFIIFSGYNEFQYVKEAIGLGVIDYLEKPVAIDSLRQAVDKGIQECDYRRRFEEMRRRLEQTEQSGRESAGGGMIRVVKEYINQHFQEGITLEAIAEQAHMSPTYFSMLFKREEGTTYIRYLTRVRMEKAMEYLRQGYKARQVCEMVGYFDYKYFSAQFKNYVGMTLDAYKRKSLGES